MMKFLELVKANYGTYRNVSNGSKEQHWRRLGAFILVSAALAVFSVNTSAAYPIMVTAITILTGFTFTALFSNHVLADVGLPKPANESDRADLDRLSLLSENFKARSSYFIFLSIFDAVFLIAGSLKFSTPKMISKMLAKVSDLISLKLGFDLSDILSWIPQDFSKLFFVLVTFAFLECLYTFFRLSETIISIVNTRNEYMKAAESEG